MFDGACSLLVVICPLEWLRSGVNHLWEFLWGNHCGLSSHVPRHFSQPALSLSRTHWYHPLGAVCLLFPYEGPAAPGQERERESGSARTSDLCPSPGCCVIARHSAQPHVAANLIGSSLLSHTTDLDFFGRLTSPPGALLCPWQARQGSIGDPK